jgi:hypothetical protein
VVELMMLGGLVFLGWLDEICIRGENDRFFLLFFRLLGRLVSLTAVETSLLLLDKLDFHRC